MSRIPSSRRHSLEAPPGGLLRGLVSFVFRAVGPQKAKGGDFPATPRGLPRMLI